MSRKPAAAPLTEPAISERVPERLESNGGTVPIEPPTNTANAAPGTAIPAESLLELLQESARRTDQALSPVEGLEGASRSVTRSPFPRAGSTRRAACPGGCLG